MDKCAELVVEYSMGKSIVEPIALALNIPCTEAIVIVSTNTTANIHTASQSQSSIFTNQYSCINQTITITLIDNKQLLQYIHHTRRNNTLTILTLHTNHQLAIH